MSRVIKANSGPQEQFLKSSADITIYGGAAGGGKLIDINEPILTSEGWKTMGTVCEGDYVYSRDGKLCLVMTASDIVMPDDCYEFTFSNGYKVISGSDHLWITSTIYERNQRKESVKDSQKIFDTLKKKGKNNHFVRITQPIEFKEKKLLKDPYDIGKYIVKQIKNSNETYELSEDYKFSSINQRLDFLRGCASVYGKVNNKGRCSIVVRNKSLMEGICEIVDSLGIKRSEIKEKAFTTFSYFIINFYTKEIMFYDDYRGKRQKRDHLSPFQNYYYICDAKKVPSVFCRCIAVNSVDNSYLVGKCLMPTHNTFALLLDAFRYAYYPNYVAVIFRREMKQISAGGGLWDKALDLYTNLGGEPNVTEKYIKFPYHEKDEFGNIKAVHPGKGGKIHFSHLNEEKDKFSWQGAEIPYIAFDELTHFTFGQFSYLLTRNRNSSKFKFPNLIRATCNPDPDSWVRDLLDPYIDKETGFPIKEMAGKIMYVVVMEEKFYFDESRENLIKRFVDMGMEAEDIEPKSMTFIPSKLTDNPYLAKDTSYRANLKMNDEFTQKQLLEGSWNFRPAKGMVFKSDWFKVVTYTELPEFKKVVRGWDFAAGKDKDVGKAKKFDNTASVKLGLGVDDYIYVLDCTNEQLDPSELMNKLQEKALDDGEGCIIRIPQDPGQAGLFQVQQISKKLMRYTVKFRAMSSSKTSRATTVASKSEQGFIRVLRSDSWNKMFFNELEKFPPEKGSPDVVDAFVEAFYEISQEDNFTTAGCYIARDL